MYDGVVPIMDLQIADHALLGDLETAALVGGDGSVDWLCLPRFDSPAACAALLGTPDHGVWRLAPADPHARAERAYRPDTLVLDTVWRTPDGAVRITDFMPPRATRPCLVRCVEGLTGTVPVHGLLRLRFHQGRVVPWMLRQAPCTVALAGPDAVWVRADGPVRETPDPDGATLGFDAALAPGQRCAVTLVWAPSHLTEPPPELAVPARTQLKETLAFWRRWAAHCAYDGPWRPAVLRSLITWKALTHAPTGAVLAAPTTSLPHGPDGAHDGDGRVCRLDGLRPDLATLIRCGLRAEAAHRVDWLLRTTAGDPAALQDVYGPAGERRLRSVAAPWFPGRPPERPVRFGTDPAGALRTAAHGEVLDALHLALCAGLTGGLDSGRLAAELTRHAGLLWTAAPPPGPADLMTWVALDRGLRIAGRLGRGTDAGSAVLRDTIRRRLVEAPLLPPRTALSMPEAGLLPAADPRVRRALATAHDDPAPTVTDGLLRVRVLAGAGHRTAALASFERILAARNDVGLFAERWDPGTGSPLGNAPSAAAHLALVGTALALSGPAPAAQGRRPGAGPSSSAAA
ncbi:glycoside hydrolase family 15 protein [Streptomyces sp. NPDC059524]|uniref:glycoside hydrolase family 15 protein n=1 Tax=Streptomyces sp. NPDC059524 TaxID=3346856 RepID=UPI00369B77C4